MSQLQRLDDRDGAQWLEAAFDAHWTWVCATLYRLVGDWDDAEDLALEVFYRLHQRPPEDRGDHDRGDHDRGDHDRGDPDRGTLGHWLYRVAINAGLNALRARRRRRRYEEIAGMLRLQRETPVDPAMEAERHEQQDRVREVLASMKPDTARVLVLRHSGLSYAEIAAVLNIAPGSVGTVLARAEKEFARRWGSGE